MQIDCRLKESETKELKRLEEIVEKGIKEYHKVGEALLRIRDKKLYRQDYKTFEKYLIERWEMKSAQAYRLIDAHCIRMNLDEDSTEESCPNGTKTPMPKNERQTRELRGLDPEKQRTVWKAAVNANNGKAPSARIVEETREQLYGDKYDDEDLGEEEEDEEDIFSNLSKQGIRDRVEQLLKAEKLASQARKIAQDEGCAEAAPLATSFIKILSKVREELEEGLR